jgi:D-3-phosphoglycerate dehydrogenase
MFKYATLNPIAKKGLDGFSDDFQKTEDNKEADAILVRSASMHDMEFSSELKCVARAGAGVNNIPLDKCADSGIVVFNTPGANANGVKELIICALILGSRDVAGGIKWVQDNKDDENISKTMEKAKKNFAGTEIQGKALGVIGLGSIGVLVANAAVSLGMKVYGIDPYLSVTHALLLSKDVTVLKSYDELFSKCDYLTLHLPLLDSTKGMINKDAFSKMKDGVILLNYSRDTLVNDDDLKSALETGKVRKYVTDFPNPKVVTFPNVVATPHLGATTAESEENCAVMAVDEVSDFLVNGNIKNSVNYPNCDSGAPDSVGRITVAHKNIPDMLAQLTKVLSAEGINISHLNNKSRGDYAYCIIDIDSESTYEIVKKLQAIDGVIKVRIIK